MNIHNKAESGQIIVIMAIVIVILLGFAALAIDVGMVYADRRYDQSVADASALAASQFIVDKLDKIGFIFAGSDATQTGNGEIGPLCDVAGVSYPLNSSGTNYYLSDLISEATGKAINRATTNNYLGNSITGTFNPYNNDISDGNGIIIECERNGGLDDYLVVTAMVTTQTNTSFAHLFFGGKMINTVTAKTRIKPRTATGFGFSIVAFKDKCYTNFNNNVGEIQFAGGGSGEINLYGGGTHSNACMAAAGNTKVTVRDGGKNTYHLLTFVQPSGVNAGVYEEPAHIGPQPTTTVLTAPNLSNTCIPRPSGTLSELPTTVSATPGWYSGVKLVGNGKTVNLSPGSYCITGDIEIGGTGNAINGNGVVLYMMEGMFKVTSTNASVNLVGALPGGLLIYTDWGNSCNLNTNDTNPNTSSKCIDIVGGSSQFYTGTILSPHGFVAFGGNPNVSCNSELAYPTQIMGWMVQINGTTNMCLSYRQDKFLTTPTNLGMQQ